MSRAARLFILYILTIGCGVIVLLLKPFPQDVSYHQFADRRLIAGIPNFANVLSNFLFLVVGLYGVLLIKKSRAPHSVNLVYIVFICWYIFDRTWLRLLSLGAR